MQTTRNMNMQFQEFGIRLAGIDYIDRPGVYAVMENSHKQVAVIKTQIGYFLPGGGVEMDEAEVEALKREVLEETGYQISVLSEIGMALEYIQAYSDGKYYRIRSTFYKVRIDSQSGNGVEQDHQLAWYSQKDAVRLLTRQSQAWAIQCKKQAT